MEESIVSLNETILQNYQKTYPNLMGFTYDASDDSLVYAGAKAKLNGYGLSRIDPIFFSLEPMDIFLFFQKGYYYNIKESEQVNNFFNQVIITDDEINYLRKYAESYCDRCEIFARNNELLTTSAENNENVRFFVNELLEGRKIMDNAKIVATIDSNSAASILYNFYQDTLDERQNNESNGLNQGMKLTREKNNFKSQGNTYFEEEMPNQKFGIAGFTSTILIISAAITFGMYLALNFLP